MGKPNPISRKTSLLRVQEHKMEKTRISKIKKEKTKKKNSDDRGPSKWKYGNITDCKKAYFNEIHKTSKSNNTPQGY